VIRDMLQILERRFPGLHIRVYPAQVQGAGSVEEVTAGIDWFSSSGWPDVVIVARGGGSLEDLWTFNEEAVARAIARSAVPVVSAIGHETDVTIADFVADLRAPTPSAAAELVVPARQQIFERIDGTRLRLERETRYRLADAARRLHERGLDRAASVLQRSLGRRFERVDECEYLLRERLRDQLEKRRRRERSLDERLRRMDLRVRLSAAWRRLESGTGALGERARLAMARQRARLDSLAAQLAGLSPVSILERGYAIVQDQEGRVVKDARTAPAKTLLNVRLAKGSLQARVTRSTPEPKE
jgi:exodeoxyribonuclease VII large subunit